MKQHSLGVLSFLLVLIGVTRAALGPYDRCGGSGYSGESICPSGYDCVQITSQYSTCLEYGSYPDSPGYTDTCPSPSTVTYTMDCTTSVPLQYYTSVYTPKPYTSVYTPPSYTPSGSSEVYQPPAYSSVYTPPVYSSVYYSSPPGYTSSPTYTPTYTPIYYDGSSSSVYTPPPYTTVYTPPAYTPQGYSSAYTPKPYTSINSPKPYTPSCSSFTSVYTPPPYTSVYTPPPYTPVGYSSAYTPQPYTSVHSPEPYTSIYTPPVGYTSVYTPPAYTSVYTPPAYTPSGSSDAYTPPAYTSAYTPPVYTSVYNPSYVPPGYTSVYQPDPYTSIYTPPAYTPSGSSDAYTPPAYTSVYTPPAYTSVYTPPEYTSAYTPPVSDYTPTVYTQSSSYTPPEYSTDALPTFTTSPPYLPPVVDIPISDYTSVPYITVDLPSYTSSYVPPVYTPMPYESSYSPDLQEPTYTPPNPYETTTPTVIIVDPPQQTGNFTPVVGAPGIEMRLPIDELQANHPDVWNMFCLALESMMAVEESLDLSYYQLSGIHGVPHIPWQYPINPATQDPNRGYCTHSSALFSTWHRPYLILVEQTLYDHAVRVAARFTGPDAQKYRDAAKKVRLPYWDWSSESTMSHLPASVMVESLTVIKPAPGTGAPAQVTISNPLFTYTFKRDDYRQIYFSGSFRDTDSTRRQPDANGVSRNPLADQEMANTYDSRRQNTFNLFSIPTFQGFTSNAWDGGGAPNAWTSVESIHNNIHSNLGGTMGHMSYVDYSAFDPIFWLHHANVDRLTAMYQAIWPGNDVRPQAASGTFARRTQPGDIDDIDTPLYPFRHPNGNEWTSRDVSDAQSIFTYGYAYPEVPSQFYTQTPSTESLQLFTTSKVNEIYRPQLSRSLTPAPVGGVVRLEWVAHLAYDQSELPGALDVLLYVGEVPENVGDWQTAPSLVGGCATFGDESAIMSHVIKATVPLTKTLIDNNIGLDPKNVVKYLRENCHWVIKQGGYSVPVSQLTSLKVGISSTQVAYPDDYTQLAQWGQAETHYDITNGRDGGLQSNETYLVQSVEAPTVLPVNSTGYYNSTVVRRYMRHNL